MIEDVHSVCINTAYVCAAGVGAVERLPLPTALRVE